MSSDADPNAVAERFGYVLKRAQQSLRARMDSELRAHGLTAPQYAVLSAVAGSPGVSNADLAKAAFVTPQTMQGIIAKLEERGLLARSPDPDHGRRLMTRLTESGRRALTAADAATLRVEEIMTSSIPPRDMERASRILLSCIDNLTEK